ncbi:hypothetical protein PTSG_01437 [Salpingoeca rosetta]|uniref:Uncharacterized protein n=1 Tax=Salpingoeca rosetta (strain ATCC 50818 / BSB-021) TaxID=946362 RepID=F2U0C3_SALR5|nr:uncharacterized protein PTSG_01437 [Salpingoeca rosetta]EGD80851.1 hypothetical protein PTSG_01437 [Salpingoeca rosetta]|eukprot:XP_004997412.1 hypothetical protein PTSG_01437 [Salpingoeca rosetta]
MTDRAKRRHDESGIDIPEDDDALDLTPSSTTSHRRMSKAGRAHLYHKFPALQRGKQQPQDEAIAGDKENASSPKVVAVPSSSTTSRSRSQAGRSARPRPVTSASNTRRPQKQPRSSAPVPASREAPPQHQPSQDVPHSDVMSLNYVDAIYAKNLQREEKYLLNPRPSRGINLAMRTVVIDWMIEIQVSFKLRDETLFCAVDILDRYLAARPDEQRHDYQCCGATSLWIASKFLEVLPPELADFEYVCAGLYPRQAFIDKELTMLTALRFYVMNVTPLDFISVYAIVLQLSLEGMALAEYLITLPLQEQRFYGLRPSVRGAAAVHIASKTCDGPGWSEDHSALFKLDHRHIMLVAQQLRGLANERPEKYINCRSRFLDPAKFGVAGRNLLV